MTFAKFETLLKTKYPESSACPHGKFAQTDKNKKVEINFTHHGKCYCYYGSYQDILFKVGIKTAYKYQIVFAERHLAQLKTEHGKPNPFNLFNPNAICDRSKEIEDWSSYLSDIKSGEYIIID